MSAVPPIKTGAHILQEIYSLGVRRVIDIDIVEVNSVICKTCGWNKRSIFGSCRTGVQISLNII